MDYKKAIHVLNVVLKKECEELGQETSIYLDSTSKKEKEKIDKKAKQHQENITQLIDIRTLLYELYIKEQQNEN